jgi:DNA-binding transcriptional regulator YhcF (GntR family)
MPKMSQAIPKLGRADDRKVVAVASQANGPVDPSQTPSDVYPVLRVSTEFFLRGFDLLCGLHDDVISGLVFTTIWQGLAPERHPISIRELSRQLALPYETVRRHARLLERAGYCVVNNGGLAIPAAVQRSRRTASFLRGIHGNAARVLRDLARIGVTKPSAEVQRPLHSSRLSKNQMAVATAATGLLLAGMKALQDFFDGDLMKGLVFTAVWTANVKHVTNTAPAASRTVLEDSQRLPISILAISQSLRLPYETVRRHVDALVKEGKCELVGRQGVMAPATILRDMAANAITSYRLVMAFVAEVRAAGVKV